MKYDIQVHLITGEAGVGKSTFAEQLADDINGDIINIATPIKQIAKELGWNGKKDKKGRSLLQMLGREGREMNYTLWVNHVVLEMFKIIKHHEDKHNHKKKTFRFIIPDVRFDDEVFFFLKNFEEVCVYRVMRYQFESKLTEEQKNDITEKGVSPTLINHIIELEGSDISNDETAE